MHFELAAELAILRPLYVLTSTVVMKGVPYRKGSSCPAPGAKGFMLRQHQAARPSKMVLATGLEGKHASPRDYAP